jgi:hypothetical protein
MKGPRYQLAISVSRVGTDLAGAPLAVEIVPESGRALRALVPASSTPVIETVPAPGNYLIRTTLPSGQQIAEVAAVPEQTDPEVIAQGAIKLDLIGDDMPPAASAATAGRRFGSFMQGAGGKFLMNVRTAVGAVGVLASRHSILQGSPSSMAGENESASTMPSEVEAPSRSGEKAGGTVMATYEWNTFQSWRAARGPSAAPVLVARRGGSGMLDSARHVRPKTNDERQCLLIRVANPSAGESVFAWLPNSQGNPARFEVDPDQAQLRSGSPLLAYNGAEDAVTSTMFSYIRRNALEDARTALPELIRKLHSPDFHLGPNRGALVGYVLYKLRHEKANSVIDDLCTHHPTLPDGHVLRGAQLISNGRADEAGGHFDTAIGYGVPTYTEGVRLLRDGANFLCDLEPTNSHLRENARLANGIAAAANFKSELTCLRVGPDIAFDAAGTAETAQVPASDNKPQSYQAY